MSARQHTLIDLIRHGQPEGGSLYRGHSIDDPLSEKGWQQMHDAIHGNPPWQHIISSPMQRCQAFAQALSEQCRLPISIETDFREVGFGSWEGMTQEQLKADRQQEYQDFYRDPVNCRPVGAEPLDAFIQRVSDAYQSQLQQHVGKHILIVAHAGVMRAIIAHTLHTSPLGLYRIKVDNAGMTRIQHDQYGGHLLYHNVRLRDMC
jgi:probable phosphoglycerate mutase